MATQTFTWRTTYGVQVTHTPKVYKAEYGDGYTARAAAGINPDAPSWSVSFDAQDDTEAEEIMAFLATANGVASFYWTPPKGVQGLYIAPTWNRVYEDEEKNQVKATFTQVFGG